MTHRASDHLVARDLLLSDEVLLTEYASSIGVDVPADEFGLSRLVASLRRSMREARECETCGGTGKGEWCPADRSDDDGWNGDCEDCEGDGAVGLDDVSIVMPDGKEVAA